MSITSTQTGGGIIVKDTTPVGFRGVGDSSSLDSPSAKAVGVPRSLALLNVSDANTQVMRNIVRQAGSGTKRGRIWRFGSSIEAGAGATSASLYAANGKAFSPSMLMTKIMQGMGLQAASDYSCADSGSASAAAAIAHDARLNMAGGAAVFTNVSTLGGNFLGIATNQTITFTPGGTFDFIDWGNAITTGGASSFSVSVDGGTTALATVTGNAGAAGANFQGVACAPGSTTVTFKGLSGQCYLNLIGTRTVGKPGIEVINAGWGGSRMTATSATDANSWNANATGAGWGAASTVATIDNTIMQAAIVETCILNELYPGVQSTASIIAANTQFYQRLQGRGMEVGVRIAPCPAMPGDGQTFNVDRVLYNTVADALRDNAIGLGLWVQDDRLLFPDWAPANVQDYYRDGFHGKGGLYNASALATASLFKSFV